MKACCIEGQSTRGDSGSSLGIVVFGGKLMFGGSALLPLNAALCALEENRHGSSRS